MSQLEAFYYLNFPTIESLSRNASTLFWIYECLTDLFDSIISSTSSMIREKVHSVNYEAIFWFTCSVEVLIILNWSANSFKSIILVPFYWSASKVLLVNSPSGLSLVQEATWVRSSFSTSYNTLSTIYWGVSTLGFCSRITNLGP